MLLKIVNMAGDEVASLDVQPQWTSRDVFKAVENCDEPNEPPELLEPEDYYDQTKYWDEMTGVPLPTEAVEAA